MLFGIQISVTLQNAAMENVVVFQIGERGVRSYLTHGTWEVISLLAYDAELGYV